MLASPPLLSDLKLAIQGSYTLITQLLAILPSGIKTAVDALIDSNALLVNLRENILVERARSLNGGEELEKAVCALERYFWLIALAGYLEEALAPQQSNGSDPSPRAMCSSLFSEWVAKQAWISATTTFVHARPLKPSALSFFAPLGDLTYLVRPPTGAGHLALYAAGSVGTELESWVVRSRRGAVLASQLLLKVDLWAETDWGSAEGTRTRPPSGTGSFRKIPAVPVYASSQPALPALSSILAEIGGEEPAPQRLIWINLREEPIIYIQEHPHVLRQTGKALRNLRSYTGITPTNLEKIEDKLAEDVKSELEEYGGKVLVHTEKDGEVVPVWVDAKESDVRTVREVFGALIDNGLEVDYHRIPTTAEQPPQEEDFDDLLNLLLQHEWDGHSTAVVFNCQMGVGRSTTGTVVATLILYWLRGTRPTQRSERRSYHAINALLRVLRNGVSAKTTADLAIDACGAKVNLRDCVDEWRRRAEKEAGQGRTIYLKRALKCLERYWIVILFQAFLDTHSPKDFSSSRRPTFKAWIAAHAEFATLRLEMLAGDVESLTPLLPHADSDVSEASVIASRSGSVLASQTILKPDLFPGCQKKTLKDRVEGAPNYRRIPLSDMKQEAERVKLALLEDPWGSENEIAAAIVDDLAGGPYAIGEAMPSASGIVHVAERSHADPDGPRSMLWTSLREEPVIYIFGEAYVLRVFNDPFKNLVITGITAERVETMEKRLKEDVLREAERYGGKILLHIEEATPDGFALVPVWEAVQESDVQTPRELYGGIISQGYRISYARVPITDEQAPIPMVFDVLLRRVLDRGYDSDMVFNCQMGRGRTTTGLAIACLAEMIVGNMALVGGDRERGLPGTKPGVRPLPRSPTTQEDLVDRYSARGEYQLILSLLPVLSHGKLAKRLTDRTLDLCSHMQNLREAIYAFRVAGEEKKKEALNYLVRYFYLIVFADYLLVEWVSGEGRQSFEAWLSERGEITSILRKQTLD